MKKPITLVSAALVAAVCSLSVHADKVYYVEPDGNNPEGMTVDAVYTKIGTAINNVTADEPVTIYLKPGHVFSENNMNTNTNRIDLTIIGDTDETGTRVTFKPDGEIFEELVYDYETLHTRLREQAFLNAGVRMTITDRRTPTGPSDSMCYEGGIRSFVEFIHQRRGLEALHEDVIYMKGDSGDNVAEVAMQYNDSYNELLLSFANNINTGEGGTHEDGFKQALTRVLNAYARKNNLLKDSDKNLSGEDCREGLTAIISVKLKDAQFEGQTKTKLGNTEARPAVEAVINQELVPYLENIKNAEAAAAIADKALKASKVGAAARKAKENAREKNKLENAPLVGKLASCTGRNYGENELFIVEGDSAGGSAKQGRDRKFQAILPLRGKPLNVEKKRLEQVLQNEEFRSIITALGTGIGEDFNLSNLRYNKVIILSDADQDGAHIRAILLTFFYRYMKELITDGHVYIGMAPLYRVQKKDGGPVYCYDDPALKEALKTAGKNYTLQRYKGLGEMNPEQLWETTMDPAHRRLIRVNIEDAADVEHLVTVLMGDKVQSRKEYIFAYADFNKDKTAFEKLKAGK